MKFTHCPVFTFGKYGRREPNYNDTPAPNEYNILPIKTSVSYSFADKPYSRDNTFKEVRPLTATSCSPGPWREDVVKNKKYIPNTPSYSFGKDRKCKSPPKPYNEFGPKYDTRNQTGKDSPKYTFGPDKKKLPKKPSKKPSKKPPKKPPKKRPMTPGPGDYEIKSLTAKETPKFSFGLDERGLCSTLTVPREKSYKRQIREKLRAKTSALNIDSNGNIIYKQLPGPGAYSPSHSITKPRYPIYQIGTSKRKALFNSNVNAPAPNRYKPNYLLRSNKPKSPSYTICSFQRKIYSHQPVSPGPCYNVTANSTCGPKFTLRPKYKLKVNNDFPGPGTYELCRKNNWNREPCWSIGSSQRGEELKKIIKENYPGPGMYTINRDVYHVGGITIGKTKRKIFLKEHNNTPGPGQYRIPCEFGSVNEYTRQQGKFDENFRYI